MSQKKTWLPGTILLATTTYLHKFKMAGTHSCAISFLVIKQNYDTIIDWLKNKKRPRETT